MVNAPLGMSTISSSSPSITTEISSIKIQVRKSNKPCQTPLQYLLQSKFPVSRLKKENQTNLAYSIIKEGLSGDFVPKSIYFCFVFCSVLFIPGEAEEGEKKRNRE